MFTVFQMVWSICIGNMCDFWKEKSWTSFFIWMIICSRYVCPIYFKAREQKYKPQRMKVLGTGRNCIKRAWNILSCFPPNLAYSSKASLSRNLEKGWADHFKPQCMGTSCMNSQWGVTCIIQIIFHYIPQLLLHSQLLGKHKIESTFRYIKILKATCT